MKRDFPRAGRILFCVILLMHYLASISGASPAEERRELWTGSLYSSTYRAGICIKSNGDMYGALYLRQANGAVDRYSIVGKVEGNRITASHHSGHEFKGSFVSEDTVRGELTLKNGYKMDVQALRSREPEMDAFCRLVQQQ